MKYYLMRYNYEQGDKKNHISGLKKINNTMEDYSVCCGKYVENWNDDITLVCDNENEDMVPDWLCEIDSWLVVSQRFVDVVEPFENGAIQYLPIKIDACQPQMQGEKYYVANVIKVLDAYDYEKSDWFYMGPNNEYRSSINYVLKKDIIKDNHIFIVKEDILSSMVVVSEELKNAIIKAKLLGFVFYEARVV